MLNNKKVKLKNVSVKKGFTLVELLAVLVILAVIVTMVFPAISDVLSKSRRTVQNIQIERILNATYDYTLKNTDLLPEYGEVKYITLNELKKENFIAGDIKEATTSEPFTEDLVISIENVGSNYKIDTVNSILKGYYLYTVETEFMSTEDFKNNRPSISFTGYDSKLVVLNINIGDEYTPLEYTASSISGEDLTDDVVENIIYKSKSINSIDTKTAGIYYVNYSVIDLNGYSNYATVNVIITDDEAPTLVVPDNETISISTTSYDLMDGVSCIDNTGKCDIDISGSIDFGISGKYIIEYSASDETGNTVTTKRVITVE